MNPPYLLRAYQEDNYVRVVWTASGSRIDAKIENTHDDAGTWEAKVLIESDHVEGVQHRHRLEYARDPDRESLARWLIKIVQRAFSTSPYVE